MVAILRERLDQIKLTPEQLKALNLPSDWKERISDEYLILLAFLLEENAEVLEELKKY